MANSEGLDPAVKVVLDKAGYRGPGSRGPPPGEGEGLLRALEGLKASPAAGSAGAMVAAAASAAPDDNLLAEFARDQSLPT